MDWDSVLPAAFDAVNRADADALAELCHDDVTIRPMRAAFEDTVYRGRTGVARFIAEGREAWPELHGELHTFETRGDLVFAVGRMSGHSQSGLPLDIALAWIGHGLDGKVLRITTYLDLDAARRDFESQAGG